MCIDHWYWVETHCSAVWGCVHTIPDSFSCWYEKLSAIVWTATEQNWSKSFTHIEHRRRGWPWGFGELNPSPHSWIFTSVRQWVQSSLLLIHFRYGPNTCSYCTTLWHRTYPICDSPLSRSARRCFAPSQKCHQNHRSVRTEALSGMILVATQKLFAIMWT